MALMKHIDEKMDGICKRDNDGTLQCQIETTATDLFLEVTKVADKNGIKTSKGYSAGDASHFMREINKVKPNLAKVGIVVVSGDQAHDGTQSKVIIDVKEWLRRNKEKKGLEDYINIER